MKRRLSLKSESLADLTTEDLNNVHGGALSDNQGRCTLDRSYLIGCYSGPIACSIDCPWTFNTCAV